VTILSARCHVLRSSALPPAKKGAAGSGCPSCCARRRGLRRPALLTSTTVLTSGGIRPGHGRNIRRGRMRRRRQHHHPAAGPHRIVPSAKTAPASRKLKEAALGRQDRAPAQQTRDLASIQSLCVSGLSGDGSPMRPDLLLRKAPTSSLLPGSSPDTPACRRHPSVYSPLRERRPTLQRRALLLGGCRQAGSSASADEPKATPLRLQTGLPKYWNSEAPLIQQLGGQD